MDTLSDHPHALGIAQMSRIPEYMEDPKYIVKLKNGRINALLEMQDKKRRHYFVSLELEVEKPVPDKSYVLETLAVHRTYRGAVPASPNLRFSSLYGYKKDKRHIV